MSAYDSIASYFTQKGGTSGGTGKAGGAGFASDTVGSQGSNSDTQSSAAQSGSGWISGAVSMSTTDKSIFSTPFDQSYGGIQNNQGSGLSMSMVAIIAVAVVAAFWVLRK